MSQCEGSPCGGGWWSDVIWTSNYQQLTCIRESLCFCLLVICSCNPFSIWWPGWQSAGLSTTTDYMYTHQSPAQCTNRWYKFKILNSSWRWRKLQNLCHGNAAANLVLEYCWSMVKQLRSVLHMCSSAIDTLLWIYVTYPPIKSTVHCTVFNRNRKVRVFIVPSHFFMEYSIFIIVIWNWIVTLGILDDNANKV